MIYVFDTSSLTLLNHFYPDAFPSLWSKIEQLINDGNFTSTREVLNELELFNDREIVRNWAKNHKAIFATPSNEELEFVAKILAIPHFNENLISPKALLQGRPVADPFVIAAAAIRKGTVVTQEKFKPNAAKISNVCHHFGISCMDLEKFMAAQKWQF